MFISCSREISVRPKLLRRFAMKFRSRTVLCLFAVAVVAGCASTNVTQQTPMSSPGLARPNQIWVYDFVAAPSDMPADSSLAGQVGAPSTPPTPEEIETGRKYGAMIAQGAGQGHTGHGHARDRDWPGIITAD